MKHLLLVTTGVALFSMSAAQADVIISVTDANLGTSPGTAIIRSNQAHAVGWTQSQSFTNVVIQAAIGANLPPGSAQPMINAFLTNQLGAGTTAANQLASGVISVPLGASPHPLLTIFSGLTLGSDTYYLSFFHASGLSAGWDFDPGTNVSSDFGSTIIGSFDADPPFASYAPASAFELRTFGLNFFTVTGDPARSVVEPGTLALFGAGLFGLGALRRRKANGITT
jgi:hypothetical protein